MAHYKQIKDGVLMAIGTGPIGGNNIKITEAEYNTLLAEIREKDRLVNALYSGEITAEEVPEGWQEEIQARADDRKAMEEAAEATEADYLSALAELGVTVHEES